MKLVVRYSWESLQLVLLLLLLLQEHEKRQAAAFSSWRQLSGGGQLHMPAFQDQVQGELQPSSLQEPLKLELLADSAEVYQSVRVHENQSVRMQLNVSVNYKSLGVSVLCNDKRLQVAYTRAHA